MAIPFSDAQKAAVTGDGNLLVSAAAGSGKTAVLTERVIRKLTDSKNPTTADRLLVVTFTNAAAAEMRSRIEKRLTEEIKKDKTNRDLVRQKQLLATADICTVDSFCIRIVRENFAACGVSPDFSVSGGDELTPINCKVMAEVLKPYYESGNRTFTDLLGLCNCEYDDVPLQKAMSGVFEQAMNQPFPDEFITSLYANYFKEFSSGHPWYDDLFSCAQEEAEDFTDIVVEMGDICLLFDGKDAEKYNKDTVALSNIAYETKAAISEKDYEKCHEFYGLKVPSLPTKSRTVDTGLLDRYKALRNKFKNSLLSALSYFESDRESVSSLLKSQAEPVKLFCEILKEYKKRLFEEYKNENVLTFAFCEQLCRELLCNIADGEVVLTEIAKRVIADYDEVLVDEYQDINDLQNMLFYVLSDCEKHLFTVGDVKQSIYGFRGSNPNNFIKRMEDASEMRRKAKQITLSENYRSREGVCTTVNFLFKELFAGQCGKIVYDEESSLKAKFDFPPSETVSTEMLIVDNADMSEDMLKNEAAAVAEYIKSVMAEGEIITDGKTLRRAKYGDFAILMNTIAGKATTYADALSSAGIPVSFTAESFCETFEISFALSFLKAIDNPKSEVDLFSVMISPIIGFTAEETASLKAQNRKANLFVLLKSAQESGNKKADRFLKLLNELRRTAALVTVDALIEEIYLKTDLLNRVSVMRGGEGKRANLLNLVRIAKGYSATYNGGVYGFLKYLESLSEKVLNVSSNNDDGVQIMSMHKSKGLQFPICIIANLSGGFNKSDEIGNILLNKRYGLTFRFNDFYNAATVQSAGHLLCSKAAKRQDTEEGLRKLYVALTRAVDRLVIVTSFKDASKSVTGAVGKLKKHYPHLPAKSMVAALSMTDWILPIMALHPDFKPILKLYGVSAPTTDAVGRINFKVITEVEQNNVLSKDEEFLPQKNEISDAVFKAVNFEYAGDKLKDIAAKISVSLAANGDKADDFAFTAKPAFMLSGGLTAAGRGTAMHHVMQFFDFSKTDDVKKELQRLCEWQFITDAEAAAVDVSAIERFFASELFCRIKNADKVLREMRFLSSVPVSEVYPDSDRLPENTEILVQGAVDLCFTENKEAVVLDFKTDRVDDIEVLRQRYQKQLQIYGRACEKTLAMPVKELIIYSFTLNKFIVL